MIFFPFVSSFLWRMAGRGGFPNALWLRRVVVPYIAFLLTDNLIASLLFAASLMLPITLIGDDIETNIKNGWIYALAAIHALAVSFYFHESIFLMVLCFICLTFTYAGGVRLTAHTEDQYGEDHWWLFEYFYGAVVGISISLSTLI